MHLDERLIRILPEKRQVDFQELEFYAFVHFTINTFTDREWGDGRESPALFQPKYLDAEQWVRAIQSAGMRGLILTCKHHDGFCLWPTRYTEHSVASSPYKNGRGDIVREVSDACRKHGIKFGIYLSPWDRHSPLYGQGRRYDDFFVSQLTELLTGYGDLFTVWFDGACGEGPNGKKQVYDWERYYAVIRRLQPDACINVCGPDIRWCGNEAGCTRPSEWSVVPKRTRDTEKIAGDSQQADDQQFRQKRLSARDLDLGSRALLQNEPELIWYPAEVNTSIRPGWFWHACEDDHLKPLDELIRIYIHSVGGNATFLLNIPPTQDGLFHEADVQRLDELGRYLRQAFGNNLINKAVLSAGGCQRGYEIDHVRTDSYENFYFSDKDGEAVMTVDWEKPVLIGHIVIKENIWLSQRVERFAIDAKTENGFQCVYSGTVIGHKKIVPLPGIKANSIRLRITDSRGQPAIAFLGIYEALPAISGGFPQASRL